MMTTRVVCQAVLCVCLLAVGASLPGRAVAQTPAELTYGQSIEGYFDDEGQELRFEFYGRVHERVTIAATAYEVPELDMSLRLYDPAGYLIARSDNANGVDPLIADHLLLCEGTYTIWVKAKTGSGGFHLRLTGTTADELNILFSEDFDDNSRLWETAFEVDENGTTFAGVEHGEYVVTVEWEGNRFWVVTPGAGDWDQAPVLTPPYEVHVDLTELQTQSGAFRVGVMFQAQKDNSGSYWFLVDDHSLWSIVYFAGSGTIPWSDTYSERYQNAPPVHLSDGEVHTLTVVVTEDYFTLFVDGQIIGQIVVERYFDQTDNRTYWPIGSIGLAVGGGRAEHGVTLVAHFDNVIVTAP